MCSILQQIVLVIIVATIHKGDCAILVSNDKKSSLNIAIIGAGPAGLASARRSIGQGHNVTVYEQQNELGGVWVYTDEIGKNKYGLNIHTAMYKELRFAFISNLHFLFASSSIPYFLHQSEQMDQLQ